MGQRRAPNRPFSNRSVWILDSHVRWSILQFPRGKLLDPFCGTGGLIIEGILCDIDCFGSDLAWPMVTGARENAAWAQEIGGSGSFEIRNGSSLELGDCWDQTFDGFAFDPPMEEILEISDEDLELFEGTLSACSKVAAEQANLVTLIPWDHASSTSRSNMDSHLDTVGDELRRHFPIQVGTSNRRSYSVHGSLARLLIHAEKK